MRQKILIAGMVFFLGLIGSFSVLAETVDVATTEDDAPIPDSEKVIVDVGDNHVEYAKVEEIDQEYRVFGINPQNNQGGPIDHISFIIPMLPLERAREIVNAGGGGPKCELQATKEMTSMPIIILNPDIKKKLLSYEQDTKDVPYFSLRIKGALLQQESHLFKGQEFDLSTGGLNLSTCLLVTDVEPAKF